MELLPFGHGFIQCMFVEPPGLGHQPADAVPVHRAAKLLLRYRKACLDWGCLFIGQSYCSINESYGKNRKRFPGKEKRMNMLLSLEPLIYLESITNGRKF